MRVPKWSRVGDRRITIKIGEPYDSEGRHANVHIYVYLYGAIIPSNSDEHVHVFGSANKKCRRLGVCPLYVYMFFNKATTL